MKNLIILSIFIMGISSLFAQNPANVSFAGGLWAGGNESTMFVGFIGPKLSTTFPVSKKTKLEIGINGIPGLIIKPEARLGLTAGSTLTIKKGGWKMKPIIGVMFTKTNTWQTLYGVGFLF